MSALKPGLTDFVVGTICALCDYDNDGWLDIVQFVWSDHEDVIHTMKTRPRSCGRQAAA